MNKINSYKTGIELVSKNKRLIEKILSSEFIRTYVPCYDYVSPEVDAKLEIGSSKNKIKIDFPLAEYCSKKIDVIDIIVIAEYLLERARQEKGVYCLSSSAAEKNGKGVLIFGGTTNLGKTSVATTLAERYNFSFLSDEKTLLDLGNYLIVGGVSHLKLRKKEQKEKYSNIEVIEPNTIFKTSREASLNLIIHPYIDNGQKYMEKWDATMADWHFFEELSRKIRGVSKRICNKTIPLPSLDTDKIALRRSKLCKKLAREIPFYAIRGTPEQICEEVNKLLG